MQRENSYVFGKLPPQACDLEEAVLGAIMSLKEAFMESSEILTADSFYKHSHQIIYKSCTNLFTKKHPIDILTVTNELRTMGELEMAGGSYYLIELCERAATVVNVEFLSQIIVQKFLQREVIRISTESISKAYEDTTDVFELIESSQSQTFGLLNAMNKKEIDDMASLAMDLIEDLSKPPVDGLTGVGTGFNAIDTLTGGWQKSDLIIIAARPSMGKTAFVLKNARNAAIDYNVPTLIFSLEMSSMQLLQRLASDESGVQYTKIKMKTLSSEEFSSVEYGISKLASAPIFIDDSAGINIYDLRLRARRMKERFGIGLIIIDYLQLMEGTKGKNSSREQEVSAISRALKGVAKELNVPVIALSQLSRAVETRSGGDKRPQLSDLRESGSIEQDADMVGFLYRPEYYGIMENEHGESTVGLCELIWGKNRAGICDTVKLDFNGAYMRFKDWRTPFERIEPETITESVLKPNTDFDRNPINQKQEDLF